MSDGVAEYSEKRITTTPERVVDESREKVILQMGDLATKLADIEGIEQAIREGDQDVVRMLGHWANQLTTTLNDDSWKTDAEIIVLIPRKAQSVEEAPQVIPEEEMNGIGAKAEAWIVQSLGQNWRDVLEVSDSTTTEEIAAKIIAKLNFRTSDTQDRALRRIELRLKGASLNEIVEAIPTDSKGTASVSLSTVLDRVAVSVGVPRRKKSRTREKIAPVVPIVQDTPRRIEPQDEASEEITLEHELPKAKKLIYEQLPEINHETISLLVAERVGLSTVGRIELATFLDPISNAALNSTKQKTVEAVRDVIHEKIDDETYELTQQERIWIHRCFGAYERQGVANDQMPNSVRELSKPAWAQGRQVNVAEQVYSGLTKIFK